MWIENFLPCRVVGGGAGSQDRRGRAEGRVEESQKFGSGMLGRVGLRVIALGGISLVHSLGNALGARIYRLVGYGSDRVRTGVGPGPLALAGLAELDRWPCEIHGGCVANIW